MSWLLEQAVSLQSALLVTSSKLGLSDGMAEHHAPPLLPLHSLASSQRSQFEASYTNDMGRAGASSTILSLEKITIKAKRQLQ